MAWLKSTLPMILPGSPPPLIFVMPLEGCWEGRSVYASSLYQMGDSRSDLSFFGYIFYKILAIAILLQGLYIDILINIIQIIIFYSLQVI